jgi:toxin YoeB
MNELKFEPTAKKQIKKLKKHNVLLLKKIVDILEDVRKTPYGGIGKPEVLKYELSGYLSRRVDKKNRIIYKYIKPDIIVVSVLGHYN